MRIILNTEPFTDMTRSWNDRGYWPARWIAHPEVGLGEPAVVAYRRKFSLARQSKVRVHVSADERYELFLDGKRIGRGPERGDRENWFYESYDLDLPAGEHTMVALTWWIGPDLRAPYAQMTVRHGFMLAAEGQPNDLLNTGAAPWECKRIGGIEFDTERMTWGTGPRVHVRGAEFPWGFERGEGDGWVAARAIARAGNSSVANEYPPVWMLRPATLPAMLDEVRRVGKARHVQAVETPDTKELPVRRQDSVASEAESWTRMLQGSGSLTIPANTMRRVIVDLENYYCAYPEITVSGGEGSTLRVLWAESLYEDTRGHVKGNRDEIEGKHFIGVGDMFEPDGGRNRRFGTLWWECGRYMEVFVSTGDEPLTIEGVELRETHYPYEIEGRFESPDGRLEDVIPIAIRGLEMCSHETYMDCPYYEQLQYVGDTRLEVLTTYAITRDPRLPRKAVLMFDRSRKNSGITQSRYPSRIMQIIPPFSLWWVSMVHDFAMWRDDPDFVADRMPGVRAVLDAYRRWINADGLVEAPNGWNYMDWVPEWRGGIPPDGALGVNGVMNWQMVYALRLAAELEEMVGEPELAERNRKLADRTASSAADAFWHEGRGIFAEDLEKKHFSEHSQCLALLSRSVGGQRRERVIGGLLSDPDLARTTIYFTHYLFETYRLIGRMDRFFERMDLWFGLKGQGFKTTFEEPEPSRSDCHAWGAHPVFHYFASVLGIRPASPGFGQVSIEPQLGHLTHAKGCLPHPKGFVEVDFAVRDGRPTGTVELPDGVTGALIRQGDITRLRPGPQEV